MKIYKILLKPQISPTRTTFALTELESHGNKLGEVFDSSSVEFSFQVRVLRRLEVEVRRTIIEHRLKFSKIRLNFIHTIKASCDIVGGSGTSKKKRTVNIDCASFPKKNRLVMGTYGFTSLLIWPLPFS